MMDSSRLRREECHRTKHDSVFSDWKIVIGSSDWEDHSLGKNGAERYKIHNLPANCSCPGLYELGIAVTPTDGRGTKTRQHALKDIVVVYLGQADNVRTRLQQYGRAGSHLDHGNSFTYSVECETPCLQKGPGLFKEIFSKGYSIVYRWAPMKDKKEAEKMEEQLLNFFDYAWNRRGNGACRREDILLKLEKTSTRSNSGLLSKFKQWKWPVFSKNVGIKIDAGLPIDEVESEKKRGFLPQIFKFVKSQPQSVQPNDNLTQDEKVCGHQRIPHIDKSSSGWESWPPAEEMQKLIPKLEVSICGVVAEDGGICRRKPVPGRKRCEEHKGKRVPGSGTSSSAETVRSYACGVHLDDGSICMNLPLPGRKRCTKHKGRWVS
ncbi:hypothetical protein MUK42_16775 [Musa troglodytarum]|uniref:Protein EFFECTOR OF TRANSCRIPTION 2-like n=1 Tax=Musa troglodytarum TaxID=320322 RepID=A0A9E7HXU1_9LILI|nr:hypothetical protein MUK42_16775 [Musa troglodytarum]